MSRKPLVLNRPVVILICGALLAAPAYGYVDPNATGMIGQIMAPVLLIGATALTFLRKQLRAAFDRLTGRK